MMLTQSRTSMIQGFEFKLRGACRGPDSIPTHRVARIRLWPDDRPLWEVHSAQKTRLLRGKGTNFVSG